MPPPSRPHHDPRFSIPAGVPFAEALAAGLLEATRINPLSLSDYLIFLPTRRTCRTVQDAFLRQSNGQALLLPRLMPLGDIDADELALTGAATIPPVRRAAANCFWPN